MFARKLHIYVEKFEILDNLEYRAIVGNCS